MLEERTSKMEDTTLIEQIETKDAHGNVKIKPTSVSVAYDLTRAGMIASGGWNLGKVAPATRDNILALKQFAEIITIYEHDLGLNHPATRFLLGKLQNHFLTLFPRSITYDAKEIDMVEPRQDDVLRQLLAKQFGLNLPIATDLNQTTKDQEE